MMMSITVSSKKEKNLISRKKDTNNCTLYTKI